MDDNGIRRVGVVFSGARPRRPTRSSPRPASPSSRAAGRSSASSTATRTCRTTTPSPTGCCPDEHYRAFTDRDLRGHPQRPRHRDRDRPREPRQGPSQARADLADPTKNAKLLQRLLGARRPGGRRPHLDRRRRHPEDGQLPAPVPGHAARRGQARPRIVHLPKTIDNDYHGIDFTFGFFTSVDVMAKEVLNLAADAAATSAVFVVETMGRKAGWLSYGVGIAGEASLVLGVEDVGPDLRTDDRPDGPLDLDKPRRSDRRGRPRARAPRQPLVGHRPVRGPGGAPPRRHPRRHQPRRARPHLARRHRSRPHPSPGVVADPLQRPHGAQEEGHGRAARLRKSAAPLPTPTT